MLKILIIEFITCGGFQTRELPGPLAREGDMMLLAVINDCLATGIMNITITRDKRCQKIDKNIEIIESGDDVCNQWWNCLSTVDFCLVIAPESEGALFELVSMVEKSPAINLGCNTDAIGICGSKYQTYQRLKEAGIDTIPTFRLEAFSERLSGRWVLKPDDGAGAEHVHYFSSCNQLKNAMNSGRFRDNYIVQPFMEGESVSMVMLCHNSKAVVLACNKQLLVINNDNIRLGGIRVNSVYDLRGRFQMVADMIVNAIPGLWGIVGIDLVMTKKGLFIVDINPRLTTSYVALNKSLGHNPIHWLINLYKSGHLPDLKEIKPTPVEISLDKQ